MEKNTSKPFTEGKRSVLIVDDEKDFVLSLLDILESRSYKVETAHTAENALNKLSQLKVHVVLIDIRLGRVSGIDLMSRLQTEYPGVICVMMTAYAAVDTAIEALHEGAYDYLRKPFNPRDLLATLDRCFEKITLEKENSFAVNALIESESKYRELVQDVNSIILRRDVEGNITFINKFGQQFFGFKEKELLGKNIRGTIVPETEATGRRIEEMRTNFGKNPSHYTSNVTENMLRNGDSVWISWSNKAIKDKDGHISEILCVGNDITTRKKMGDLMHTQRDLGLALSAETNLEKGIELCLDAALMASGMDCGGIHLLDKATGTFKLIFDKGIHSDCKKDKAYVTIDTSSADQIISGQPIYSTREDSNLPAGDAGPEETPHAAAMVPLIHEGQVIGCLNLISRSQNHIPLYTSDAIETIASQVSNIIIRLRAEVSLRVSEEKYRLLVENSNDAIFIVQDSVINFSNRKANEITGYSLYDFEKMPFDKLIHPSDKKLVQEMYNRKIEGEEFPGIHSLRLITKTREEIWAQLSSVSITWEERPATINFLRDISQIKKLEAQLQQAQKMEAIGTLAGGIAHDFNNILAAIMGYTEIANFQIDESSPAKTSLLKVLDSSERAKSLVNQILSFSRRSEEEKKPTQIAPIVKEVFKLLRASLPSSIEIRHHINDEDGVVEADPTKIHQVLMNLCTNAHHAMRDNGGILDVVLCCIELKPDEAADYHDLTPGSYLKLSVNDTGIGMDKSTMGRIFEPYFTTKEKGEGTGLGLAVVHGIVNNYNGTINVESEKGKGTTFHLYLPRVENEENIAEAAGKTPLPSGKESILFIDDEPDLVDIGKQMLEHLGYNVTIRTNCVEALELFKSRPDNFDLIITDTTMPSMTGVELSGNLMGIRPDIPIILCTGFNESITELTAKEAGIKEFVMKPLIMKDLASTVRAVLDSSKPGSIVSG